MRPITMFSEDDQHTANILGCSRRTDRLQVVGPYTSGIKEVSGDFAGGPVVKNQPSSAGDEIKSPLAGELGSPVSVGVIKPTHNS